MDRNFLLLLLLGCAILTIAGLAVFKAWYDNRAKRNKLTELALIIHAVKRRNILSGQREGFCFTVEYNTGYDEYEMPGMRITLAANFPATLLIYRDNPVNRVVKKIALGRVFKTGDPAFDQRWHLLGHRSTFFQQWFNLPQHRELVDELMQTGCSIVKIEKTGLTAQWYTLKTSSALSLMEPHRIDSALDNMVAIALSLTGHRPDPF